MDCEKLIELVKNNPALYDMSHDKYSDSGYKEHIWKSIGEVLKQPGVTCKSRWANIRDNFRKSRKKRFSSDGVISSRAKKYKYEYQLLFLLDLDERGMSEPALPCQTTASKAIPQNDEENSLLSEVEIKQEQVESEGDEPEAILPCNIENNNQDSDRSCAQSTTSGPRSPQPSSHKKVESDSTSLTLMNYIMEKNRNQPKEETHPVDAFLAGLAPTLKSLTPFYLNLAKAKMCSAVMEYELAMIQDKNGADPQRHK